MSTIMLSYEFMRTAFVAAAVVALLAGPVGYFLVLRGQTFAGHALAHVGFTGATGAVLLGLSPLYGLFLLTVAAGLAMGAVGEKLANRDVAIGLVLALALGIGLLFLHFFTGFATQATALLFGNILAVSKQTLVMLLVVSITCILVLAAISRPLLFVSLQPELAEAKGVHSRAIATVFLVIVAVATAGAAQIVGVLLVFALMVGPAAAAQRLTLGVISGLILSAALALAEAWGGLALAYVTDWPTSFWITALSVGVYVASLMVPKAVHR
jgi:zinc/manganese transport system permease protein